MRIPWGKYRGQDLTEIPLSYLVWLLEEAENLKPFLREAIREEVGRRLGFHKPQQPLVVRVDGLDEEKLLAKLNAWWRSALLKAHPDKETGDVRIAQQINRIRDDLEEIIRSSKKKTR